MRSIKNKIPVFTFFLMILIAMSGCRNSGNEGEMEKIAEESTRESSLVVSKDLDWSERMMMSVIYRAPESEDRWNYWSYENGLLLTACKRVYEDTRDEKYYDFIYDYGDRIITDKGEIKTYSMEDQNLDKINSGRTLLYLYEKTGEERFLKAANTLRKQLESQPRTSDGGFWHKKRYPSQMWLDGLYMAEPFYAQYTLMFDEGASAERAFDDIVHQFDLIQKHALDEETGLLYHGWDESKKQKWADKETGTSPNFWSRAMGWYGMAMVDVLDYLPQDHEGRDRMIRYLRQFAEAVTKVQDDQTGLWYQVLDKADKEGNYLEASGSSMFTYTLATAAKKGYIPEQYLAVAEKGYQGLIEHLISVDENGVVNLHKVCAVAGLGGDPYRDASYEYYVNETIAPNDPKGTGSFILASLALGK